MPTSRDSVPGRHFLRWVDDFIEYIFAVEPSSAAPLTPKKARMNLMDPPRPVASLTSMQLSIIVLDDEFYLSHLLPRLACLRLLRRRQLGPSA